MRSTDAESSLEFFRVEGRRYARFPRLGALPGLAHAFSTRPDDVSPRDDERRAERAARRARMATDLGLDPARVCYCVQVHGTRIAVVADASTHGPFAGCDALVTDRPGAALMTFSADCPLILAYDPRRRALGAAHASWRGTVAGQARRLIEALTMHFGCDPAHVRAGVGPSAGPGCYEVREDVFAAAAGLAGRERFFPRRDGKMYFDLWEANRVQLVDAGLRPENVELARVCTMTATDVFYSYRREGPGCGHFGLMAGLLDLTGRA